ncbi:Ig-like domain-containing protein [Paenibacillus pasadenensis]|uniref:Ig-like domain-containing protein n=1 Tax=Paenibacillus pasadenensis TaxID=217090 RepID=UPI00041CCAC1|nr:Ig-like domain-containing protein [Paenibacillus pasadenensis]
MTKKRIAGLAAAALLTVGLILTLAADRTGLLRKANLPPEVRLLQAGAAAAGSAIDRAAESQSAGRDASDAEAGARADRTTSRDAAGALRLQEDQPPPAVPAVGFTDPDAAADRYAVALSARFGTLEAGRAEELTLIGGAPNTGHMEWTGSSSALHRMLASLRYEPLPDAYGRDRIDIRVVDSGSRSSARPARGEASIPIVIEPVNDAPLFEPGPSVRTTAGSGPQRMPGWSAPLQAGPDSERQTLWVTIETDRPELFRSGPALEADGTLSFEPASGAGGSASVTVQVRDDGGTSRGGSNAAGGSFEVAVEAELR